MKDLSPSRYYPDFSLVTVEDVHEDKVYQEKDQFHRSTQRFHMRRGLS